MHAGGRKGLLEEDENVKAADAVGIEEQRIETHLDQRLPPADGGGEIHFFGDGDVIGVVQIDVDGQPAGGLVRSWRSAGRAPPSRSGP